jgi:hypothetical protein
MSVDSGKFPYAASYCFETQTEMESYYYAYE